jgi:vancomycin resistance protein YoaR
MKFRFFVVGSQWMFVVKNDDETVEDDWELTAYYNEWQEKWEIKIRRKVWELKKNDDWWLVEEKEVKIDPEKFFDAITKLFREEVEKQ